MAREIPLPWKPYFDKKNVSSVRDLGRKLEIHQSTAGRAIHGEPSDPDTLEKLAAYFGLTMEQVQALRGEVPRTPFKLPPEADRLTSKQREAVRAIVQAMVFPESDARPVRVLSPQGRPTPVADQDHGGLELPAVARKRPAPRKRRT